MCSTLDLDVAVRPGRTVVTATGELDMDTSSCLRDISAALGLRSEALVLDLTAVTFADACGLNALLVLRHRVGLAGGTLELGGLPDQVLRLLELTGTRHLFTLRAW
ncbi:STAS domain-containing protein [Streptomyces yangpuensis]|uniref:STAS domain-containing protein n=1 Tax=Streptomyces yangpuensis TaxID=1648182 RepID=UPI00371CCBE6